LGAANDNDRNAVYHKANFSKRHIVHIVNRCTITTSKYPYKKKNTKRKATAKSCRNNKCDSQFETEKSNAKNFVTDVLRPKDKSAIN